jgi:hypothetical protein
MLIWIIINWFLVFIQAIEPMTSQALVLANGD